MKKILLLLVVLMISILSFAEENQLLLAKANKAYIDGSYENAIEIYKKVLQSGVESWELYYNMGNSYFKINDFPSAILFYEKARKLNPGNEDIDFNLKVANNKIADKIEPLPEIFYKKWFRNFVEIMSVDQWAWLIILSLILALFSFTSFVVSRNMLVRKAGFWLGIIFVGSMVISFRFAYLSYNALEDNSSAIIFTPTVTIKSSPDDKSTDLFVLHEGTKVQILDNIGTWYEIKIANGSVGWLPVAAVEKI